MPTFTNITLVATVLFSTNVVESLHPSGEEKLRTESVFAVVTVPGWSTNVVGISTNSTRYAWCEIPLKLMRDPLTQTHLPPPMPPLYPAGVTNQIRRP